MRKALNKLRSNTEVRTLIDAAEELEASEGKILDANLAIYSPSFRAFVRECSAGLADSLTAVSNAARRQSTALNESFSHRKIKGDLRKLLANQDAFARLTDLNRELERRFHASEEALEKRKAALERAQAQADHVAVAKAQVASGLAKDQLERDQKAYFESNEKLDFEGEVYRQRIIAFLTEPFERMLENRRQVLLGTRECAAALLEAVRAMSFEEEAATDLELQLELINAEIGEMGG
jgi:hypothetical protein